MYAASSVKRQKVAREATRPMESTETFLGIGRLEYKPDAIFTCEEQLSYRYYNATERLHGRPMEEWLRPSVFYSNYISCYTQTATLQKAFEDVNTNRSMETTKKNIRAMFEMCLKLGVKYWSGYENELVPDGNNFEETQTNFEQIGDLLSEYQQKTGVKPLWIGVNFIHNRYINGAMTNSDANIVAFAGYQTKRALDLANKLNAESFFLNGNREGYNNAMNTDLSKEIKFYARFLKLVIEYRDKIGFRGQMIFDYDDGDVNQQFNDRNNCFKYTMHGINSMLFLKQFNFDRYFKVNVSPGYEFHMASAYGCLGGIDIKRGEDIDTATMTLVLRTIIEKGGLGQAGITFRLPIYNRSCGVEPKEAMENHVGAIDALGKALRLAVKLVNDAHINKYIQTRYASFQTGWGLKFMTDASLSDCDDHVKRLQDVNALCTSNKANHWFVVLQRYIETPQNLK